MKDSTFSFREATVLTVVPADPACRDADMLCLPCGAMPPQPADILPAIDFGLRLPPKQSGALPDSRNPLQRRASAAASAALAAGTAASADSAERGGTWCEAQCRCRCCREFYSHCADNGRVSSRSSEWEGLTGHRERPVSWVAWDFVG